MAFKLFKKTSSKSDKSFKLRIKEVVPIARDAVNLIFEKPERPFEYQPGQFLTIIDKVNGEKIRRAYSLCSNPFEDQHPAVTVKRVVDGRMSNHINDSYQSGQEVEIVEPMGMFTTEFNSTAKRKLVFLGGGSGITPLYSMIRSTLLKEPESEVTLIYGNRSEEFIIFKDQLKKLSDQHAGRFDLVHILEEDSSGLAEIKGRPSAGMLQDLIQSRNLDSAEFFICGPKPMMDVVTDALKNMEVLDERIKMESFEAGVTSKAEDLSEETDGDVHVVIILDGDEHEITMPKNRTILESALDEGLDMPYSCQSGLCTACRGFCHDGEISSEQAEGLSDEELAEGYRLLCVGKPLTSNIKVEVG